MQKGKVSFVPKEKLIAEACDLLAKYHPTVEPPIPIEYIIEQKLEIDILPVPGLEEALGRDCYISSDFKKITIDQWCFDNQEERARFSLAHEIGHLVLHKDLYSSYQINDLVSYKEFLNSIPNEDHKKLELQANIFAGFILLPPKSFENRLDKISSDLGGLDRMSISDIPAVVAFLKSEFKVTGSVIEHQLRYEYRDWLKKIVGNKLF